MHVMADWVEIWVCGGGCHHRIANPMQGMEIHLLQSPKKGVFRCGTDNDGTNAAATQEME